MRKETCTYNELGEFLMVSGIGKRTGHSTLKNAKEKASLPTIPLQKKQYKTTRQLWHYNTALVRTQLYDWVQFIKDCSYFPEEAFKYRKPEREGFHPYEL